MSNLANHNALSAGRASLEFLVAAIVLFIPVMVFATISHTVVTTQLATEAAARHAARVFVQHTHLGQSVDATHQAVRHALGQHGIDETSRLDIRCRPQGACLRPDSWVEVSVTTTVPIARLPLVPSSLPPTITISADASAQVSRYRGAP